MSRTTASSGSQVNETVDSARNSCWWRLPYGSVASTGACVSEQAIATRVKLPRNDDCSTSPSRQRRSPLCAANRIASGVTINVARDQSEDAAAEHGTGQPPAVTTIPSPRLSTSKKFDSPTKSATKRELGRA